MGHFVSLPLTQSPPYDLIVDIEGVLHRVQVKWAQRIEGRVRKLGKGDRPYYFSQLSRRKAGGVSRARINYQPTDFDIFALVCRVDLIYFIPMSALCNGTGQVPRQIRIKDPEGVGTRRDSLDAVERWERFRNILVLPDPPTP